MKSEEQQLQRLFFRFAVMTAEEMASDEMKAQRERFTQQVRT